MEYISISEFARKYDVAERTVRYWCATGKFPGAFLTGKTWNIPSEAEPPAKGKTRKESPLLKLSNRSRVLRGRFKCNNAANYCGVSR